MTTTAERLHEIMNEKGLKQSDIIEREKTFMESYNAKLTRQDISQYCSGKVRPSQDKLFLLAAALNVNEAWLMGYDVPQQRTQHLQELTDPNVNPEIAIVADKGYSITETLIRDKLLESITTEEIKILEAYRNSDRRTQLMILYMLKLEEMNNGHR